MKTTLQDLRYAVRVLLRAPGFSAAAVLTLTIGIGANVAVFSAIHGILLKPLPYANPEQLVRIFDSSDEEPAFPMAPGNFKDYRDEVTALESLAAYERADLQLGGDRPEQLRGMRVTAGFFTLLGAQPVLGRDFTREEEVPSGPQTTTGSGGRAAVILSHGLWQRRFGSDPAIIGSTIHLSGRAFVVVGILRPGFQHVGSSYRSYAHGETVDVWWVRSISTTPAPRDRFQHYLNVVGRLKPGVSIDQAREELAAAAARLAARYPRTNEGWSTRTTSLKQEIVGDNDRLLMVLLGAVQLVLLLACANVAGLLVGRATMRAREVGVRIALGATRGRIVQQLATESMVLALAGGALGTALAAVTLYLLPAVAPPATPRLQMISLDATVLGYALLATLVTSLLFGLTPALQLAWTSVNDALKHAGRGLSGAPHRRLRTVLVGAEIAVAFVLLVGAGLLLRSFVAMTRTDPGFSPKHVLTAGVTLPGSRYGEPPAAEMFYARLRSRVLAIPGVHAAGFGSSLPWTGYDENTGYSIVGRQVEQGKQPSARFHFVTAGYFEALGQGLHAGRDVEDGDRPGTPAVVLINMALARLHWGGSDPAHRALGAQLNLWGAARTVVGVVGDIKDTPWAESSMPAVYFPLAQQAFGQDMFLTVRSDLSPAALMEPIARAVHDVDPALPLANVKPLDRIAGDAMATRSFVLLLIGGFGIAALFLAIVGVYSVIAQGVGHRAGEFGLRQALGAGAGDIVGLVMRGAAALVVAGVAVGCALGLAATRVLRTLLYAVDAADPLTFAAVTVVLLAVSLAASYIPARRATRLPPAAFLSGN